VRQAQLAVTAIIPTEDALDTGQMLVHLWPSLVTPIREVDWFIVLFHTTQLANRNNAKGHHARK